ncbi:calcium-dependent protein kinase 28-like protein [Tanacetum coccineum]
MGRSGIRIRGMLLQDQQHKINPQRCPTGTSQEKTSYISSSNCMKCYNEMFEDVNLKREVKILRALTGHENVVMLHNAFEDDTFVYIVNGVSSLIDLLELP